MFVDEEGIPFSTCKECDALRRLNETAMKMVDEKVNQIDRLYKVLESSGRTDFFAGIILGARKGDGVETLDLNAQIHLANDIYNAAEIFNHVRQDRINDALAVDKDEEGESK